MSTAARITDALRGEHAAMRPLLRGIRESSKSGMKMDPESVRCYAKALKTIIHAHATVEEPFLLKPLQNFEPARHALEEHKEITLLTELAIKSGSQKVLHKLVCLALGHFAEEEEDLFPLAEKKLTQAQLVKLGSEWAQARAVRLG